MKELFSSIHLNGHTLEFYLQARKFEPPCTHYKKYQMKVSCLVDFT